MNIDEAVKEIEGVGLAIKELTDTTFPEALEKRDAELREKGHAIESTGKRVDELGEQLLGMRKELEDALKVLNGYVAEGQRNTQGAGADPEARKSLGEIFTSSEVFKTFAAAGDAVVWDTPGVPVKNLYHRFAHGNADPGLVKALTSTALDALILPQFVTAPILEPQRQLRIRDLLTVSTVNSDSIVYPEETGWKNLYTVLTAAEAGGSTVLDVASTSGFYAGQTIDVAGESRVVASVSGTEPGTITITAGLTGAKVIGDAVTALTFGGTPEGGLKPQASTGFIQRTVPVITLAHWIAITRQALADANQIRSYIDRQLVYGLKYAEEWQILYGLGASANQLAGILTHASVPTYLWSSGVTGDTRIDAIRRAMNVARMSEYPVDGLVLNPTDWTQIQLTKGTDGHYVWVNVAVGAGPNIWGLPVVETTAIAAGTGLVGAFKLGATLWDREQATVRTSEHHEDFFGKNLVAVLAEQREALATQRPKSFVEITFNSAPA